MTTPLIYQYGIRNRVQKGFDLVDPVTGDPIVDEETGEVMQIPTRTKQEFKDDTDIQKMYERFTKTGRMNIMRAQPQYLDLTELPTFQQSQETLAEVKTAFRLLPAAMRYETFDNDEGIFVDWIQDPANLTEAREIGLLPPLEGGPPAAPNDPETPLSVTASPGVTAPETPPVTPPITGGE